MDWTSCYSWQNFHRVTSDLLLTVSAHLPVLAQEQQAPPTDRKLQVESLLESGEDANTINAALESPLAAASSGGHDSVVEALLKKGPPQDQLQLALERAGSAGCAHALLKYGAAADSESLGRALVRAAEDGRLEVLAELLTQQGALAAAKAGGVEGVPATVRAAGAGHVHCVRVLLHTGVDPRAPTHDGDTPLEAASRYGRLDCMYELLYAGVDPNMKNDLEYTALHLAAKYSEVDCVRALLQFGADVGLRDSSGHTALHHAALNGRADVVRVLLEAGADANAKDNFGNTAIDIAASNNHAACVLVLLQYGTPG